MVLSRYARVPRSSLLFDLLAPGFVAGWLKQPKGGKGFWQGWFVVVVRKLILVGAALWSLWSAQRTAATVLLSDSFTYADGALVTVSTNVWLHHSPSGSHTGEVQVVSGKVFLSQTNSEDVSSSLQGQPYPSSTNIYLYSSFTVNFATAPTGSSGDYFAHFKTSGTSGFSDRLFATTNGASSGFFRIGIANASGTAPSAVLSSDLSLNTDYLLVTRLVLSNGISTLWLNPSTESDPNVTATDAANLNTITTYALREDLSSPNGMGSLYLDNLLIGTSFSDVVAGGPPAPPGITTQPQSQTATEGDNVSFTVLATGSPNPTYQWRLYGTNLPGAVNSSLTLNSVTTNQAGPYTVGITNSAGWTNSDPAILTVNPLLIPPVITAQPQSQSVSAGMSVTFSVAATATPAPTYQWQFNGTNLAGATGSILTLTSLTTNQAGTYTVGITNAAGSTNSDPATLAVLSGPLTTLSLLTYNVKGNGSTNWSTNAPQVQAIGRQLMYLQPDIVTFNEIPKTNTWQMTNWIAAFLPGYSLATNSGTDNFIRSVIASRYPITRSQKWLDGVSLAAFGYGGNFTRDLFEAQIAVPNFAEPLHVFVAHLKATTFPPQDDADKRAAEASAISNFFFTVYLTTNYNHPYVLAGDMNEDVFYPDTNSYTSGQPIQRLTSPPTGLFLTTPVNSITHTDLTVSIQATKLTARFDYILPCNLLFSNILSSQVFRTDLLTNPPPTPPLLTNDDKSSSDHLPVMMVFGNPYVFRLTSIAWNNPGTTLQWNSLSNGVYRVSYKTNLADVNWASFNPDVTGRTSSLNWTDATATVSRRFYRVTQVR